MAVMGLVYSPWVILVVPGAILLGAAFSAAGLAATSFMRTVQDFDLPMGLVVMPMFLFGSSAASSSPSASTRTFPRPSRG
jgi:lipooligosaccharide transport system permease protein